jgi:hypothetical protein
MDQEWKSDRMRLHFLLIDMAEVTVRQRPHIPTLITTNLQLPLLRGYTLALVRICRTTWTSAAGHLLARAISDFGGYSAGSAIHSEVF